MAAVSSFGIGGTNSHLVLESVLESALASASVPAFEPPGGSFVPGLLTLSSGSAAALRADANRVADYLAEHPGSYRQVLRHLQAGRPAGRWRMAARCPDAARAVDWLRSAPGVLVTPGEASDALADSPLAGQPLAGSPLAGSPLAGQPAGSDQAGPGEGEDVRIEALVEAWLAGASLPRPGGPAQPPWDFPPPSFELTDFDFARAGRHAPAPDRHAPAPDRHASASDRHAPAAERHAPAAGRLPASSGDRLPEESWLHQPQWVRWRRAAAAGAARTSRLLVVMTAEPLPAEAVRPFEAGYARVIRVSVGPAFGELPGQAYQVDPTDPASLARLLRKLAVDGQDGIDWLHTLPLAVTGPVGQDSLDHARSACLDTPAALLQALDALPVPTALRPWWLSYQGQPVEGSVLRPEFGLLAGPCEVGAQESGVDGHWLDLPSPALADWAAPVAALLAGAGGAGDLGAADGRTGANAGLPRRLALRQGYWWQPAMVPVTAPEPAGQDASDPAAEPVTGGVYLVLGGTGGIGSSIAAWLLAQADCRVILLARRAAPPAELERWADRVQLVEADLTEQPAAVLARLEPLLPRLDGVVHAAGLAAGTLIARRDAAVMRQAMAAKLHGCLLTEGLIQRYQPAFAAYCSSMSALFGGTGQLDYAAANGLLDGFAWHRGSAGESTVRLGIDWDIWSEVGMARQALRADARHQAHLAVGLGVAEGQRVFARALRLQLPQLLVSTTALDQAGSFYAAPAGSDRPAAAAETTAPAAGTPGSSVAEQLADCLCQWLGVDRLDPAASLYDLGADSLVLLDLIGEVKQRFGVDIELARLSHRASLAEVLAQYEAVTGATAATPEPPTPHHGVGGQPARRGSELANGVPATSAPPSSTPATGASATSAPPSSTPATGAPPNGSAHGIAEPVRLDVWQDGAGGDLLCLIHPVGGDIQAYRSLVSALDPRLTVCLIADPALYRPELPPWSVDERARRYHDALQARFPRPQWRWRLAGWSFGGWVALTMAARSEAAGQPVAGLYLLDPPAPGSGTDPGEYDEQQLRAVFALELGQRGQPEPAATGRASAGPPEPGGEASAYAERLARCCRANLASMANHRLPALAGTPTEVWLASQPVPGLPEPAPMAERQRLWQGLLPGLARCHGVETTHDGIVRPPVVRAIAEAIGAASLPVYENC